MGHLDFTEGVPLSASRGWPAQGVTPFCSGSSQPGVHRVACCGRAIRPDGQWLRMTFNALVSAAREKVS